MPPKQRYTHLSQRNQILKRPGQHIGSTRNAHRSVWLAQTEYQDDEVERVVEQTVEYNPGLIHIFYEVLGNAQDNYFKSLVSDTPLKKIDISVDKETGLVTVWNDGNYIPTVIHEWDDEEEIIDNKDHYEAEIIFGHLNSSGNYNDDEEARVGGGLHGVGVKLTNIFSSEFKVEAFDPDTGLKFTGVWKKNMSEMCKPKITKLKQKKGFTKVSYTADFSRFGVDGYTDDHLAVMKKLCIDCAMITGQNIYFNGEKIPVRNLMAYVSHYTDGERIEFKSENSTVVVCEKPAYEAGLTQMSWVNGINTVRGGVHIDAWKKEIFQPLLEKIKAKFTKGKGSSPLRITMKTLEQYFMLFITCNVDNPDFDGQTKGVLSGPTPKVNVTPGKINSMMKWNFVNDIEETIRVQGLKELKKTDGSKKYNVSIPKADDANKAGSVKSYQCTLFITEGLSAKSFAVKGISAIENGTNWYGVLPIRGKGLNVRKASAQQINDNREISQIKEILGLRHNVDYSDDKNFKTLRYGQLKILTDADPDGDHIKGLIINFFYYFFPSLVERGFITSIRTPIVKATIGKRVVNFYYLKAFKDWEKKQNKPFEAKYYKGLGTSNDDEILEVFKNPRNIKYINDKDAKKSIQKIFDKDKVSERKKWLENFDSERPMPNYEIIDGEEQVPVTDFVDYEFIIFSMYDNQRSLPSVVDGLKVSQRQVLWAAFQVLNLTSEYKVAQFANEAAKRSDYHHGEAGLGDVVVKMAQTFIGSNNIALLFEAGQFGTRIEGGKDASATRYISTKLASIARYVFRREDDPILKYNEKDGKRLEPKYYVPIIPLLLANGCNGIGTGSSTHVPSFNPLEIVEWIRVWLADGKDFPELKPWYWGFKGRTERDDKNPKRFIHYGQVKKNKDYYEIVELPVRTWTDDYKQVLDGLKNGKSVKSGYETLVVSELKGILRERKLQVGGSKPELITRLKKYDKENGTSPPSKSSGGQTITKCEWHGDAYNVNFRVWAKSGGTVRCDDPKFKLTSSETTTNMNAYTPAGGIKKYEEVEDILDTFCQVRLEYYQKRKKHLIVILKDKLAKYESKARFIRETLKDFDILKQTEEQLFSYFKEKKYWVKDSYKYLTNIPVRTFTADHYQKLLKEIKGIKDDIIYTKKKEPVQMWKHDLDEFVTAYGKWKAEIEKIHEKLSKQKIKFKPAT